MIVIESVDHLIQYPIYQHLQQMQMTRPTNTYTLLRARFALVKPEKMKKIRDHRPLTAVYAYAVQSFCVHVPLTSTTVPFWVEV